MNIGNITSNGMDLNENGKIMQIEVYEKEIDTYKIFRQLEERRKRRNPYTFYDKDELVDEILKLEDNLDQLTNNWNELEEWLESNWKDTQDIWYVKIINKMNKIKEGCDK